VPAAFGACFFFQAEDGIRDFHVTGVQTCALPILTPLAPTRRALFRTFHEGALMANWIPGLRLWGSGSRLRAKIPSKMATGTPDTGPEALPGSTPCRRRSHAPMFSPS